MEKSKVIGKIHEIGILPVLRADSVEQAIDLAEAIEAGGVNSMEVTMTVPGALEVIRTLAAQPGLLVGAGSVLDPETARLCILAGAQFVVSPVMKVQTIEMCHRYGIAVFSGALTPTEVITAWEAGSDAVKVFPCSAVGGASYLKALRAPMPQLQLIPTGGVSLSTAESFLKAGAFALGVGGDLVNSDAATEAEFNAMTENAKNYLAIVQRHRQASGA
jgi:2-dehydro-3-deoxyphosphogluconate aldolase/(4S)-4-hydroxy-2-oxoglutarate aldolase